MLPVKTQAYAVPGDFHGHGFKQGRHHLAGQEAVIDQLVQVILFLGQAGLDLVGGAAHIRGTNCLVGILGIFPAFVLNGVSGR